MWHAILIGLLLTSGGVEGVLHKLAVTDGVGGSLIQERA